MNFENFIQVEKEYHNKTTAMRWSEAKYGIEISFPWFPPEKQGIPEPVHNKRGGTYWLRQSYRHNTACLLIVSCP